MFEFSRIHRAALPQPATQQMRVTWQKRKRKNADVISLNANLAKLRGAQNRI